MRIRRLSMVCIGVSLLAACAESVAPPTATESRTSMSAGNEASANARSDDSADNWNYPNDNYYACVNLKGATAPMRYEDFSLVSAAGNYLVRDDWTYDKPYNLEKGYCQPGQVRLDAHEMLRTTHGLIVFHKGGQGYGPNWVPYGYLSIDDIQDGAAISPQRPLDLPPGYGIPSAISGTNSWDWEHRNGRGCAPSGIDRYQMHIIPQDSPDAIPATWQYKPKQTSSRFNKYADAGPEQSEGTEHYGYLMWSWLTKGNGVTTSPGGGMVRSLIKDGQPFYRCRVQLIDSKAYARGSTAEIGRVTAMYGKTRASNDGPWIYGWAIYSHRAALPEGGYGPEVLHVTACKNGEC
jgi:hypothetical protein